MEAHLFSHRRLAGAKGPERKRKELEAVALIESSCNPCTLNAEATFTGSGFTPGQAYVYFYCGDSTSIAQTTVDADGNFSFAVGMNPAGAYDIVVYQREHGNKLREKAELTLTVE
jgi:hypothetical protein